LKTQKHGGNNWNEELFGSAEARSYQGTLAAALVQLCVCVWVLEGGQRCQEKKGCAAAVACVGWGATLRCLFKAVRLVASLLSQKP